jgi:hypothetical protein
MSENVMMNWPTTPNWDYSPTFPQLEFKFHLINDDSYNLKQNLQFLIAFTSGMHWVQVGRQFKSPNVYQVHVPGRFRWYWSALAMNVKTVGKIFYDRSISGDLSKNEVKMFSGENGAGFPEVFEVSLSVKSLVPNNFNLYIDYLLNGQSGVAANSQRVSEEIVKYAKNLPDKIGNSVVKIGDYITGGK